MNKLEESTMSYEVYSHLIRAFFQGKDEELPIGHSDKGHLWICAHDGFDTLTWEPWDNALMCYTGQYEIAVRIHARSEDDIFKYPGYVAGDGYLSGKGTGGH